MAHNCSQLILQTLLKFESILAGVKFVYVKPYNRNLSLRLRNVLPYTFLGLTAMVKHDDHAMTWYDHGDSYSPRYGHGHYEI